MRIKNINKPALIKTGKAIKKTEGKSEEIKDSFVQTSGKETSDGSVKEWIGKNIKAEEELLPETKKRFKLGMGAAGAGVLGIVAGYALGGAAGAGAAGGLVGYGLGYMNEAKGGVNEVWKDHNINNPVELTGWSYSTYEYGHSEAHHYYYYENVQHEQHNSDGTTYTYYTNEQQCYTYYTYEHDGYKHNYSPNINWEKVGEFKTPHLVHENPIGPLAGSAIGIGAGALGGALVEGISSAAFNTVSSFSQLGGLSGAAVGIGAAVGGAVGAAAGYIAGKMQEKKNVTITRTYPVPVSENKYMGEIPDDWTQHDWSGMDFGPDHSPNSSPDGNVSVYRTAPVLDENGEPVMSDKTETLESKKYSKTSGAFIGAGVGAVAGLLASVAFQLI